MSAFKKISQAVFEIFKMNLPSIQWINKQSRSCPLKLVLVCIHRQKLCDTKSESCIDRLIELVRSSQIQLESNESLDADKVMATLRHQVRAGLLPSQKFLQRRLSTCYQKGLGCLN